MALVDIFVGNRLPEQVLDALRDGQERRIDYHVLRSERAVVDLLRLALGPRKPDYTQPPLENSVTLTLVQRASRQATEALRGALTVFAQVRLPLCRVEGQHVHCSLLT